jgi:hypothetical protein
MRSFVMMSWIPGKIWRQGWRERVAFAERFGGSING